MEWLVIFFLYRSLLKVLRYQCASCTAFSKSMWVVRQSVFIVVMTGYFASSQIKHEDRTSRTLHIVMLVWCLSAVGQYLPKHGQPGNLHAAALLVLRVSAPHQAPQELPPCCQEHASKVSLL